MYVWKCVDIMMEAILQNKRGGIMDSKPAVKIAKMHKLEGDKPLKAFVDIVILDTFIVKGLRVVEGKNGLFLAMPSEQSKDGKWYETFHTVSKETRAGLQEFIVAEYLGKHAPVKQQVPEVQLDEVNW